MLGLIQGLLILAAAGAIIWAYIVALQPVPPKEAEEEANDE